MLKTNEIVKEEFDSLLEDIKAAYNKSGKRVSGNFEKGLEVSQNGNKTSLKGYAYLAGRAAGGMPPVQNILAWVEARGIFPAVGTQTGLAWAIAKKIQREGTNSKYHLKIYEQIVTPQRIQSILDRVVAINIQEFVNSITIEIKKLTKEI